MAGIALRAACALVLAASVQSLRVSEEEVANASAVKWTYFPPEPRLGIAIGGTPEEFATGQYGAQNALILLQYAKRKG
eukprot:CAMPEP_0171185322 /NCGR_PEP_ID=MMETSP0790-20130122/16242_1 /TAXON_ID=2925 /ORGANISM="Alexandrium catenella, Strain OF101" /LENGTH=77 /DNA_ID=CAMNT_0011650341 /DNA_START=78 /DNA_END=308 /DNA_ORIENTATION=+